MKKLLLMFAAALIPLAVDATAAGAQVVVDHGYYPGGGLVVFRGGPVFRGYYFGPGRWYGPSDVGVYPAPPHAVDCYRWRRVRTASGPQWRKVNVCNARVRIVPTYPIWHPGLTAYY